MNRLSIAALVILAGVLMAAGALAEELALPKDPIDYGERVRTLTWKEQDIDGWGDTNRNGDEYVEDGEYHGGQGSGDPIGPFGSEDDEELVPAVPIGLVGVRFGGGR